MSYFKYRGEFYESHSHGETSLSLSRYDSDQSLIVPISSIHLLPATEDQISSYKMQKEQYLHALRMKEAEDKGYICYAMNCKGYRVSGSDFCHDHMPAPDPGFYEPEPDAGSFGGQLGQVLAELGEMLRKKNKDYGSS